MSYTNVWLPNRFSTLSTLAKRVLDLEHEVEYLNNKLNEYEKILYNIPEAVKEYGYVDIKNDSGDFKITLIEKPKPTESTT